MNTSKSIYVTTLTQGDAKKLMSEEHQALGYRPPPGSLAAEAQSATANKSPSSEHPAGEVDNQTLEKAALDDATRIAADRGQAGHSVNLDNITQANKLMSEEHKALGYRPPPGSLAAEAQSAAAQHPNGTSTNTNGTTTANLAQAALADASRVSANTKIDLSKVGSAQARTLMSAEHKALGYRPPPGSLAASAQAAASLHPDGSSNPPTPGTLKDAAISDAERIEIERRGGAGIVSFSDGDGGIQVDLECVGEVEARRLMSAEHKALGYRPPPGSLAADAQRVAALHPRGGTAKPDPKILAEAAKRDAERIASERVNESKIGRGTV